MDCNREEAIRAKGIAEKKMQSKDFAGARKIAIKAQQLYPELENISQMCTVCEVHCSAEKKLFGSEMDWYGILQIDQTATELTIKKQYRKFALQLHPDKNKFAGAEAAFKLIGEAQRVLLDRDKRSMHDMKRKGTASRAAGPYRPPPKANWNSNVGVQNNFRGNFSGVNLQNQQQQPQPFPPGYSDARSTFWTACPFCSVKYQYYREVLLRSLRCQSCNKPFIAYDTNAPGAPPPTNLNQQTFPKQNPSVSKSEVRFQGNVGAQNSKAESFQKKAQKAGSSSGVRSEKGKRKRGRKHVVESSESSVSESSSDSEEDMVIDDAVLQAGLKSGIYGQQQPRRSSRNKQHVSYKENLSDDDGVPLTKREKRSGSSCATEEDVDASKEEESKMNSPSDCATDTKGDKEKVKQKESACFEDFSTNRDRETKKFEAKEKVKKFDSKKNSEAHENSPSHESSPEKQEPEPLFSFPDSEFNDFEKNRREECFEAGQVWALYDTRNAMPRFYARIKKVYSPEFKVQIVWLEPDPDDDKERKWAVADLPFSCGKFRQGHSDITKDLPMFSHLMTFQKVKSAYKIYPRKGETWAIFKNWDINWYSDPDCKRKFEYEFVQILSEYADDVGISVALLEKVKGFVSVFCQSVKDGKGTFQVLSGELLRFSHRVLSCMLTGDEGVGVPSGSVELDPAALSFSAEDAPVSRDLKGEASTHANGFSTSPDMANEYSNVRRKSFPVAIEIPEAVFYNFDVDKRFEKFEIGQVWALYSDEDGLPKYYGQVKKIDPLHVKLQIAWLSFVSLPENVIRWHDKEMPICCGRYRVKRSPLQDYDSTMSFSHQVTAVPVSKNELKIFPQRGEVWALYKNWTAGISCSDLETCEYDVVIVVHAENDLKIEVLILERVDGFNSVFKTRLKGGSTETMTIRDAELLRFSHRIPSFRLTEERGGSLRGCLELDPAALPVRFFGQT